MSARRARGAPPGEALTPVFAALGDGTRMRLLGRLCSGEPLSISELSGGSGLTRQAIRKHLGVLEGARLVRGRRLGRERRYEFAPGRLEEARRYLERVSADWDRALGRLKAFVETRP
jgi:DNA-binding transcriptional ArsR family regulator